MTISTETQGTSATEQGPSLFGGLSDAELLRIRVKPAQFARMVGCSKQSVSRWIKGGVIAVSPIDGTLDPRAATAAILRRADPHRIRSRVLRSAAEELAELRRQAARLAEIEPQLQQARAALAEAQAKIDALGAQSADDLGFMDAQSARLFQIYEAVRAALPALERSADPAVRALVALQRAIDAEEQRDDE